MIKCVDETIRQYAKTSEISLKQVLDDLKNSGFSCNADDVVDNKMRKKLSDCFRKRQRTPEGQKKADELKCRKAAKAQELKRQQKAKAEELKQQKFAKVEALKRLIINPKSKVEAVVNAQRELEEIKIKLLLELCTELIPAPIISKIGRDYGYQSFRGITQWMVDEYGLICKTLNLI